MNDRRIDIKGINTSAHQRMCKNCSVKFIHCSEISNVVQQFVLRLKLCFTKIKIELRTFELVQVEQRIYIASFYEVL